MRILVTGHLGYIGSIMIPMLLAEGHEVVGMDCDFYAVSKFGDDPIEIPNIKKDIRDVEKDDLQGFDALFHLAGLSNDPLGNLNPKITYEINHIASVRLAKLAKETGIKRFIFSSSCSVYGASGDDFVNEEAELNPVTHYGKSKMLVEKDVSKLADSYFSPTFLRNGTAYGVSNRLRFDLVLNNLTAWAFTTGMIHLKSDGTPWRPLVHIEDISRAFIVVMNAPRELIHNQIFNVGTNQGNYRVRNLARIVRNLIPGSHVDFADDAGPDQRNYRVDCSKIAKLIPEFKPHWTVQRGVKQLYEAFKKNGLQLEDFEGVKYKRIDQIKRLIADGFITQDLRWQGNKNYNILENL